MPSAETTTLARSFVRRPLQALGARFDSFGAAHLAFEVPGGTRGTLANLGIVDLSPLPRVGFKGRGTIPAMRAAGVSVEPEPNRAFRQPGGELCAVLAPGEVVVLSGLDPRDGLVRRLAEGWSIETAEGAYLVPRASSHAWFRVVGEKAPAMFARICGIDLRPHKFSNLAIAQTSVVKLTGIVIRDDLAGIPAFHLLVDSASAEYVWNCLMDAMAEFGGCPAGLAALLEPAA